MPPRSKAAPAPPRRSAPERRLLPLILLTTACAAAGAGPSRGGEADLSRELAGRTAGAPQDCVAAAPGASLVPRGPQTLVYRRGGAIWVNRLAAACPGLGEMSQIVIELHGSQYCRGDPFQAREPGLTIPGLTCVLGRFTPYRR